MKTSILKYLPMLVWVLIFSCSKEEYELDTTIVELGSLTGPENGTSINIDVENGDNITLSWSPAKAADGGLILYKVLFDEAGGDFSNPIYTMQSDNKGGLNTLTISPVYLNIVAASAGIEQLATGKVIWTVQASSAFQSQRFSDQSELNLTRPEGLAVFPKYMYVYGSATEGADLTTGIAFKEIANELPSDNFVPGVFESITGLKPGEYYIADSNNPDSIVNYYYINENGKIRSGNTPTTFSLPEGAYRVRMNLSTATISFEEMSDMQLYIFANGITKANLSYIGNHTFEATDGLFKFLKPGDPEAPGWLGWEEERYRFKFKLDGVDSYIGSYHNEGMNASLVPGYSAFSARPNGSEPNGFWNTFFHGENPPYWQGAWKFGDAYNNHPFTVRVVFDPKASHYYHEFELN
jgi:starch-binding outer membrane protein SusE/F